MNATRAVGLIAMLAILPGCANPVARHYVASGDAGEYGLGAAAAVEIRKTANMTDEEARLHREGWRELGRAAFEDTGTLNHAQLVAQARSVGADLVLWHGWSVEQKRQGEQHMTYAANPGVDVSASAGESTFAPPPVISRSREIYTVTVTHFTISFWRKIGLTPLVNEHKGD